jgi:hypothetical protein
MHQRRKKTRATREHLIRKADGGTDADSNIVMACHRVQASWTQICS